MSKPSPWPLRRSFHTVVKFWMIGVLELEESFDSLMLCRSKNSPNSVSLFSMSFALDCMMVNEFPSTACVGIDVGSCCGFSTVVGELQELHTQSLIRMYSDAFMYPSRTTIA